jgi:hypothetical protein
MTAHFASIYNYYRLHHLNILPEAYYAYMIYGSTILWLTTVGLAILLSIYIFFRVSKIVREAFADIITFLYKLGLIGKFGAVFSNIGKFFRIMVIILRRVILNITINPDRKTTLRVDTINILIYPNNSDSGVPTYTPSTTRASLIENLDFREALLRIGLNS